MKADKISNLSTLGQWIIAVGVVSTRRRVSVRKAARRVIVVRGEVRS